MDEGLTMRNEDSPLDWGSWTPWEAPSAAGLFPMDEPARQLWIGLAKEAAIDAPPQNAGQAQSLFIDLLLYPRQSTPRKAQEDSNRKWIESSWRLAMDFFAKNPSLETGRKAALKAGGEAPPLFKAARLRALAAAGADPVAAKALARAAFRKNAEELHAALELQSGFGVGQYEPASAGPLHRAAYQGPNPLFAAVAMRAKKCDWEQLDKDGKQPFDKALQIGNLKRSLACMACMDWSSESKSPLGEPAHRLAVALETQRSMAAQGGSHWIKAFEFIAKEAGLEAFHHKGPDSRSPYEILAKTSFGTDFLSFHSQMESQALRQELLDGPPSEQPASSPRKHRL